ESIVSRSKTAQGTAGKRERGVLVMTCNDYKDLLMGYLDGELSEGQKQELEKHLQTCSACREELESFRKLIAITDEVTLLEPEDKLWELYWGGIYNRIERSLGWMLFGIAAIALLIYGGFETVKALVKDPTIGIILKIGICAMIGGLVILFVSVLRERLFFWNHDRYKDVRR
ncbi:MAG: zf-HC2 domain-containing protein, partial [Sedimentisphaerales bacterium]|nr:zf-HC2 domain-containing protein [Sedimentisphaerales bacterium]